MPDDMKLIDTSDLKLAAWALWQPGAVIDSIRSEVKSTRSRRPGANAPCNSNFVIDVDGCELAGLALIAMYHQGLACPEVITYEQTRNRLLSEMRESHEDARREYEDGC